MIQLYWNVLYIIAIVGTLFALFSLQQLIFYYSGKKIAPYANNLKPIKVNLSEINADNKSIEIIHKPRRVPDPNDQTVKLNNANKLSQTFSINPTEVALFSRLSNEWWNKKSGPFAQLHNMQETRVGFIKELIYSLSDNRRNKYNKNDLSNLSIIDIGCGGGILSESLVELGANVTGIDASKTSINVANLHKSNNINLTNEMKNNLQYFNITSEELVEQGKLYDIVCALEVVEHVNNPKLFIENVCKLAKKNTGIIFISTINRTILSYILAILSAEYIFHFTEIGTHEWKKFIKPNELYSYLYPNYVDSIHCMGMIFNPINNKWIGTCNDNNVNYILAAKRNNKS